MGEWTGQGYDNYGTGIGQKCERDWAGIGQVRKGRYRHGQRRGQEWNRDPFARPFSPE